jgi:N6-adenosine-specific RNA methylase IME4
MTQDELIALPVVGWAEENAHLYLWSTNAMLPHAFPLLAAWGFTYKTTLTWAKPRWGLGSHFRGQTEHVVFGIRGELQTRRGDISTLIEAPTGQHSEKPERFYDIVRLASYPPYGEAFQRTQRPDFQNLFAERDADRRCAPDAPRPEDVASVIEQLQRVAAEVEAAAAGRPDRAASRLSPRVAGRLEPVQQALRRRRP